MLCRATLHDWATQPQQNVSEHATAHSYNIWYCRSSVHSHRNMSRHSTTNRSSRNGHNHETSAHTVDAATAAAATTTRSTESVYLEAAGSCQQAAGPSADSALCHNPVRQLLHLCCELYLCVLACVLLMSLALIEPRRLCTSILTAG